MASLGAVHPYRHLARSARSGAPFVPRRTLTYTPARRAQEDENSNPPNNAGSAPRQSALSSIKNFFFGGKKPDGSKGKITRRPAAPQKREGSLSADSIFAEDEASPKLVASGRTPTRRQPAQQPAEEEADVDLEARNRSFMQAVLDPQPQARIRWERKMVARTIRRRGRLTKTEEILRSERESLAKSHWFKTSVKKLTPLARQIAGKNIDEAILQMRFSKKKAAKDVLEHLKHAKNVAIVNAGMGLGAVQAAEGEKPKPITVTLKSGERKVIKEPTDIYIAQAWVNRGPFGVDYDHRARGNINLLRPPHTGLSVVLKEEKTRIREWKDREAKAERQRKSQLWTQLPDRKITAQNQYYSW
ncbi:39S ribosomal protein L22, mitochondrial [Paecilomyces lecythidis]|uniref:39S ribosomal protein L22, mitochondrial n=1 Tax=Paecilomyces lecythidis TaxID=3004212 RepID=A0ABR3WWS7_9EURO